MSVKKKTSTIKVQKPVVSSTIDMHLTHNDVIDVAVEEQKERLEKEIKDLEKQLKQKETEFEESLIKIKEKIISELKVPIISSFQKMFPESTLESGFNSRDRDKDTLYRDINFGDIEKYNYKTISAILNNCMKDITFSKPNVKKLSLEVRVSYENMLKLEIPVPESIQKELIIVLNAYKKEFLRLTELKVVIILEVLEYLYNEKRIRSKFVKTALRNTSEGKVFLELLETSTKVKLLN